MAGLFFFAVCYELVTHFDNAIGTTVAIYILMPPFRPCICINILIVSEDEAGKSFINSRVRHAELDTRMKQLHSRDVLTDDGFGFDVRRFRTSSDLKAE